VTRSSIAGSGVPRLVRSVRKAQLRQAVTQGAQHRPGARMGHEHPADLVIADWPLAAPLLTALRVEDLHAPVVVFARGHEVDRREALRLGATDALLEWANLFREVDRVLG
jgi:DNA-binding response OmpR family regulator